MPTAVSAADEEVRTYSAGLFGLVSLVALGAFFTLLLTWSSAGPGYRIHAVVVALACALMALAAGALLGLLFGIPRFTKTSGVDNAVAPNNNLEQISDWLTKMIVGITLVEFNAIATKTRKLALLVTEAIAACQGPCNGNYAFGLAILGFYGATGFLLMYIWSRIYLLLDVDRIQRGIDTNAAKFAAQLKAGLVQERAPKRAPTPDRRASLAHSSAPEGIRPGVDPADPWKGVFEGSPVTGDKTRQLSATVSEIAGTDYCMVTLSVTSLSATDPLTGEVTFYLHDTFPKPVQTVSVVNGRADLSFSSWGAFTVGAVSDKNRKMELNLSELPGAPSPWKDR